MTRISWQDAADYLSGELDDERTRQIEEIYFEDAASARRLEQLESLGREVRELFGSGRISISVTSDMVTRARASGLKLRSYQIAAGGGVKCTAAPDDDFVVVRFAIDVGDQEAVDLAAEIDFPESGEHDESLARDVVVDRSNGEIVFMYSGDAVRRLPRTHWTFTAQVRGATGTRQVGPYHMNHTPWEQGGHALP